MSTTAHKAWQDLTQRQKVEAGFGMVIQRVEKLEGEAKRLNHIQYTSVCEIRDLQHVVGPLRGGFFGRLRWLFLGK